MTVISSSGYTILANIYTVFPVCISTSLTSDLVPTISYSVNWLYSMERGGLLTSSMPLAFTLISSSNSNQCSLTSQAQKRLLLIFKNWWMGYLDSKWMVCTQFKLRRSHVLMNPISSAVIANGVSYNTLIAVIWALWPLSFPPTEQSMLSKTQM